MSAPHGALGNSCGLHSASFVNSAEIMPTVRKAAAEHLKEYIDLAAGLGCEYLVIHCGFHFSVYLERVWTALCETFSRAVEYAERKGVPLVIEYEPSAGGLGVPVPRGDGGGVHHLFRRIRSPYLGLALDVAHCHLLPGGVARFVRTFPSEFERCSSSDNHGTVEQSDDWRRHGGFYHVIHLLRGIHFSGRRSSSSPTFGKSCSRSRLLGLLKAQDHGKTKGNQARSAKRKG